MGGANEGMEKVSIIKEDKTIRIPDEILDYLNIEPTNQIYFECKKNEVYLKKFD